MDLSGLSVSRRPGLHPNRGLDSWRPQAERLRGRIEGGEPFKWLAPYLDGPAMVA